MPGGRGRCRILGGVHFEKLKGIKRDNRLAIVWVGVHVSS
jgi:hypothetical protein